MKPHNVLMGEDDTPVLMDFGSMGPARVEIRGQSEALALQVINFNPLCAELFSGNMNMYFEIQQSCVQ